MSFRVRGDFSELKDFEAQLAKLVSPDSKLALNRRLAEEARTQALLGFEQSRDPYGSPWKAPIGRPGGRPLLDSGRLRNSIHVKPSPFGFEMATNVKYAATHQYGAAIKAKQVGRPLKFQIGKKWRSKYEVRIPRRQFIPEGNWGSIWTRALTKEAEAYMAEIFE